MDCAICGKPKIKNGEFCSSECFSASRRITKTCRTCEREFQVLRCFQHKKFCSRKCIRKTQPLKLVPVTCAWCSSSFLRHPSLLKAGAHAFCKRSCYNEFHSQLTVESDCESCGTTFSHSAAQTRKYCSRACYKKDYQPVNYSRGSIKGQHQSNKGGLIRYDSSLELKRIKSLDFDESVTSFKRCEDKIPWKDANGTEHLYHPDFEIVYDDKRVVVEETKGYINEHTTFKVKAAKAFYEGSEKLYRVLYQDNFDTELEHFVSYYENGTGVKSRPRIEWIFMRTAIAFARQSTCNRLSVGAMFVDPKSEQVLCFGYNGTWAGGPNDCDSAEPGKCGCVHAEVNAMTKATQSLENSTLFVTTAPCFTCSKILINRRISRVVYLRAYRDVSGIRLLRSSGIEVTKYSDLVDFLPEDFEEASSCNENDAELPGLLTQ